jgi:transposase
MSKDYTQEFKEQARKLVTEQAYTPCKAARELGIPNMTLRLWLKQAGWKKSQLTPQPTLSEDPKALQIQVRDLQARIKRLETEKEILKKATAYFASLNP